MIVEEGAEGRCPIPRFSRYLDMAQSAHRKRIHHHFPLLRLRRAKAFPPASELLI
jgi:hypothetical protein